MLKGESKSSYLWLLAISKHIYSTTFRSDHETNQIPCYLNRPAGTILLSSSSLARVPITCSIRRSFFATLAKYRFYLGLILSAFIGVLWIRYKIQTQRKDAARVPGLVSMVLDRLATQAALREQGSVPDQFMSLGQLRDDVLRDEFSASRRETESYTYLYGWHRDAADLHRHLRRPYNQVSVGGGQG